VWFRVSYYVQIVIAIIVQVCNVCKDTVKKSVILKSSAKKVPKSPP